MNRRRQIGMKLDNEGLFKKFCTRFLEYWNLKIIDTSTLKSRFKEQITVFFLIAIIVVFASFYNRIFSLQMIIAAFVIGFIFSGSDFFVSEWFIPKIFPDWGKHSNRTAGKSWIGSFFGVLLGFVLWSTLTHISTEGEKEFLFYIGILFFKILPIWFLVVFLMSGSVLKKQLRVEVEELGKINPILENFSLQVAKETNSSIKHHSPIKNHINSLDIEVEFNKTLEPLLLKRIVYISVEEHYCQILLYKNKEIQKIQLRGTLKSILNKLPEKWFLQIHRSCVVNLFYISKMEKNERSFTLYLKNQLGTLPISRYRLSAVLPILQEFLNIVLESRDHER